MERRKLFEGISPLARLIIAAAIAVVFFSMFFVIGLIIAIPLFGVNIFDLTALTDITNPDNLSIIKYLQIIQTIGLFVIPPFIIAFLYNIDVAEYLKLKKPPDIKSVLLVVVIVIVSLPLINWIAYLNSEMHLPGFLKEVEDWMRRTEAEAMELTYALVSADSFGVYLVNLFMIAVLPALGEELFFRGVIQKIFGEITRSHHWAIWITAMLFSVFHFQFLGFFPRLMLGVLFGYMLVWSGTLWLPIIAHFINNAFAVTVYYLSDINVVKQDIEQVGTSFSAFSIIINIVILSLLFYLLYHIEKQSKTY